MKNLLTQWENWGGKPDESIDEKPPNPVGVLRRKTDALYVRLQLRGVGLKGEVGARRIEISISGSVRKSCDFQAKGFNAWITRTSWKGQKHNKNQTQLFLVRLLELLAGRPRFRFGAVGLTVGLAAGLMVGLAIGGAVSMASEVAVGLSGWSLWNELMSFLRCWTADAGSQVFSSFG